MKSPITTHVLDISRGRPAAGVQVMLARQTAQGEWLKLASGATNEDGRIMDLLAPNTAVAAGIYRLAFDTGGYFRAQAVECFYPCAEIIFEIKTPDQHYHVPLLLSPFGYSTYRGS